MSDLDEQARRLTCHIAAPLVHAVRMQPADVAVLPLRDLTRRELEAVALILAGMADPARDPLRALAWLTDRPYPEHCDEDTDAPPLRVGVS